MFDLIFTMAVIVLGSAALVVGAWALQGIIDWLAEYHYRVYKPMREINEMIWDDDKRRGAK